MVVCVSRSLGEAWHRGQHVSLQTAQSVSPSSGSRETRGQILPSPRTSAGRSWRRWAVPLLLSGARTPARVAAAQGWSRLTLQAVTLSPQV